jgi:hypothetical protein
VLVEHHVLQDRPEVERLEDVGLALAGQVDRLGVAAPLDVEDARIVQQCSSSPMSRRFGSAESVVLPVPESPKSTEERPETRSAVAEQCIESTPASASGSS